MATLDNSPEMIPGQSWDKWLHLLEDSREYDAQEKSCDDAAQPYEQYNMKLKAKDMKMFGICPSQDEVMLVVCNECGKAFKSQALQEHIEFRHNRKIDKGSCTPLKLPGPPSLSQQPLALSANNGKKSLAKGKAVKSQALPAVKIEPITAVVKVEAVPVVKVERMSVGDRPTKAKKVEEFKVKTTIKVEPDDRLCFQSPEELLNSFEDFEKIQLQGSASSRADYSKPLKHVIHIDNRSSTPVLHIPSPPPPLVQWGEVRAAPGTHSCPASPSVATLRKSQTPSAPSTPVVEGQCARVLGFKRQSSGFSVLSSNSTPNNSPMTSPCTTPRTSFNKRPTLLKDRIYDPDEHCGVLDNKTRQPCTRTLTCKVHTLSNRRLVQGRTKSFDTLLYEHRLAKEALAQQVSEATGTPLRSPGIKGLKKARPKPYPGQRPGKKTDCLSAPASRVAAKAPVEAGRIREAEGGGVRPALCNRLPALPEEPLPLLLPQAVEPVQPDGEEEDDNRFLPFHPRPAAAIPWGARHVSNGLYVFNRPTSGLRTAFTSMMNQLDDTPIYSHHQPVPDPFFDPYDFTSTTQEVLQSNPVYVPIAPAAPAPQPQTINLIMPQSFRPAPSPVSSSAHQWAQPCVPKERHPAPLHNPLKRKRSGSGRANGAAPIVTSISLASLPPNMAITLPAGAIQLGGNGGKANVHPTGYSLVLGTMDPANGHLGQVVSLKDFSRLKFTAMQAMGSAVSVGEGSAPKRLKEQETKGAATKIRLNPASSPQAQAPPPQQQQQRKGPTSLLGTVSSGSATLLLGQHSLLASSQGSGYTTVSSPQGQQTFVLKKEPGLAHPGTNGVVSSTHAVVSSASGIFQGAYQVKTLPFQIGQLSTTTADGVPNAITLTAADFTKISSQFTPRVKPADAITTSAKAPTRFIPTPVSLSIAPAQRLMRPPSGPGRPGSKPVMMQAMPTLRIVTPQGQTVNQATRVIHADGTRFNPAIPATAKPS